jgi:hypothetical protein
MPPSSDAFEVSGRLRCISALVLVVLASLLSFGQATETLPLYEAMREGKVVANFTATGASSGDSIEAEVSKGPAARAGALQLTVPPGLKLLNGNGSWQSMVISGVRGRSLGGGRYIPTSTIMLTDSMPSANYVLSAYCAEFHKDNPSPSSVFALQPPDSIAACILSNAAQQGLSVQATQAAVWIYTDHVDYGTMSHKFPVLGSDWQIASAVANACNPTAAPSPIGTAGVDLSRPRTSEAATVVPGTIIEYRGLAGMDLAPATLTLAGGRLRLTQEEYVVFDMPLTAVTPLKRRGSEVWFKFRSNDKGKEKTRKFSFSVSQGEKSEQAASDLYEALKAGAR